MICTTQLIHNIQFSYIYWKIRSVLFFFLSREENLGSFFSRSHVFILLLYLALSVIIEAAAIWHEFVLYEEFVLHEIAEQLNKLHSAFGAFSQSLRIASGITRLATALKAVRDVHDFPVFRTSQSSPFFLFFRLPPSLRVSTDFPHIFSASAAHVLYVSI